MKLFLNEVGRSPAQTEESPLARLATAKKDHLSTASYWSHTYAASVSQSFALSLVQAETSIESAITRASDSSEMHLQNRGALAPEILLNPSVHICVSRNREAPRVPPSSESMVCLNDALSELGENALKTFPHLPFWRSGAGEYPGERCLERQ